MEVRGEPEGRSELHHESLARWTTKCVLFNFLPEELLLAQQRGRVAVPRDPSRPVVRDEDVAHCARVARQLLAPRSPSRQHGKLHLLELAHVVDRSHRRAVVRRRFVVSAVVVAALEDTGETGDAQPAEAHDAREAHEVDVRRRPATVV